MAPGEGGAGAVKRLLAATDLSPRSDRALDRAARLARQWGAELTVLHVVDDDLPASLADRRRSEAELEIRRHLAALPDAGGSKAKVEVVYGQGFAGIIRVAEEREADLVVLGTHRESGLRDIFVGTTVERVLRHGGRPVLLVRDRAPEPYRRVLIAVDFSVYSRRALEFAFRFAPDGEFHIVHAYDVPFSGLLGADPRGEPGKRQARSFQRMVSEEMDAFLAGFGGAHPHVTRIVRQGAVTDIVAEEVASLRAQLLVVGTHGRTGVAHALLGSVAGSLMKRPPCDVLAVRAW
ncbi:MAG TPA: universal stress protein [Geminicoccaceae bacterium]|nr:universal stress protein [Geminicoccaceae bacterium]